MAWHSALPMAPYPRRSRSVPFSQWMLARCSPSGMARSSPRLPINRMPFFTFMGYSIWRPEAPSGLRLALERAETLTRYFEVVAVLPPNEEEAIRIVTGVKKQYEKFHGVVVTNEAVEAAVSASRRFLRHRHLPDRAIDLIDEAEHASSCGVKANRAPATSSMRKMSWKP